MSVSDNNQTVLDNLCVISEDAFLLILNVPNFCLNVSGKLFLKIFKMIFSFNSQGKKHMLIGTVP